MSGASNVGSIDAMQERLDRAPETMRIRRQTAEHPFGTIKAWMGATHFLTRTLEKVRTEMSLHVPAYNLKRVIAIFGAPPTIQAMRAPNLAGCIVAMAAVLFGAAGKRQRKDHSEPVEEATAPNAARMF